MIWDYIFHTAPKLVNRRTLPTANEAQSLVLLISDSLCAHGQRREEWCLHPDRPLCPGDPPSDVITATPPPAFVPHILHHWGEFIQVSWVRNGRRQKQAVWTLLLPSQVAGNFDMWYRKRILRADCPSTCGSQPLGERRQGEVFAAHLARRLPPLLQRTRHKFGVRWLNISWE